MMIAGAMSRHLSKQTGDMIPLLLRHEIQVLLRAGHAQTDVASRAGVSIRTIRRVLAEEAVTQVDDHAERRTRSIGRPSKATAYGGKVRAWLAETHDLPTQELLRRANEAGYTGHKTAFYALVAGVRPPRSTPVVRFEGLPGEFSQHDFGQVDVTFVDGKKKRVHFFASRLKYSRYVAVTLVKNERVETIVRCLARDFTAFGGLPLMAVFDRPRTIVKKAGKGRDVHEYNATFAQAIVDIGVGVEMCAPRSGNQKGAVERLVGWVKSSFFKHRKFQDQLDLEAQLAAWLVEANTKTPSRATKVIPETRRQEELVRLRPVKVFPEKLALRFPIFVGPTAEVMFEGVPYSMQPEATLVAGTVFLYEDRLRIVAGRFEALHHRRNKGDPPSPLPEHRAAKIAAVHGKRAKLYEKRQQVLNLGPDALALLTEITHREPRLASRRVEELYVLLERHGDNTMREAIGRAVERGQLSVAGVRRRLPLGALGPVGECQQVQVVQPRGPQPMQLPLPLLRAATEGGAA
jgi:transposase